jgi:glycosyltransferase involved in cell wall biosynthesis
LVIIPHVSHSKALMSMSQCDILILPAYKSKRYMGMPIKLLEYLISGKLTFVGECDLYRNILPSNLFQLIYPSSEPHSLSNFIQSFINDNDLREILTSSIAFASEYTWERRTLKMLNSALNLDVLEN